MTKQLSQTALYGELQTSIQRYRNEVGCLPCLTREQEQVLIERAREEDMQARDEIIKSCLDYVLYWAGRYYRACKYHSWRIEYEELVGIGNGAIVECFKKAIFAESPIGYLKAVAKIEMKNHCHYYQSIIVTPERERGNTIPVESLDIPLNEEGTVLYRDFLEAPVPLCEEPKQDYTSLYQSLAVLTKDQREVIERYYGLGENCCDVLVEMNNARRNNGTRMGETSAYTMHATALKKLHVALQSPQKIQASYPMRKACEVLRVTPTTLNVFVAQQRIRKFGRGIYSKDDVDKMAQEREAISA